jgi:hypothetical protein
LQGIDKRRVEEEIFAGRGGEVKKTISKTPRLLGRGEYKASPFCPSLA